MICLMRLSRPPVAVLRASIPPVIAASCLLAAVAFGQEDAAADAASAGAAAAPATPVEYGQTLPVFLVSFIKPILFLLAMGGWAWCASRLDKDADFYNFPRQMLGLGQLAVGALGAAAMLFIPIFWLGFPLGLLILAGGIIGYVVWRNPQVPADARWTFDINSWREQVQQKREAREQRRATLTIFGPGGERVPVPAQDDPDYANFHALDELLDFALPRNASVVDMAVDPRQAKYRVEIDGVRYARPAPEPAEAVKFFDYLKRKAGIDNDDKRRQQEGTLKIAMEDYGERKIELITAGSTQGMQARLQIATRPVRADPAAAPRLRAEPARKAPAPARIQGQGCPRHRRGPRRRAHHPLHLPADARPLHRQHHHAGEGTRPASSRGWTTTASSPTPSPQRSTNGWRRCCGPTPTRS